MSKFNLTPIATMLEDDVNASQLATTLDDACFNIARFKVAYPDFPHTGQIDDQLYHLRMLRDTLQAVEA